MANNPPEGSQRIIPMLVYEDAPKAIEFLCKAFGFEERYRLPCRTDASDTRSWLTKATS